MKKTVNLLFLLCVVTLIKAQDITQKAAYSFTDYVALDKVTLDETQRYPVSGLIVFSTAEGQDFFTLLFGEDVVYNGTIRTQKTSYDNGKKVVAYAVANEFQGQIVPLQVMEIYDTSKSSVVPASYLILVYHKDTGDVVQATSVKGVRRVR